MSFKPGAGQFVSTYPDLPIGAFQRIAQSISGLAPARSSRVRRKGFELSFNKPRILIPRGVETSQNRLRAAYVEQRLTFQHIFQAITFPKGQEFRAKLISAILNSQIAVWFAFHGTASFGSDRPEVQQAELLRLPFPAETDLPDPERARTASKKLVALVDEALHQANNSHFLRSDAEGALREIDRLAFEYFCLSDYEITLIEDTVNKIIPAAQPHEGSFPDLWQPPTRSDREDYSLTLADGVAQWLNADSEVIPVLEARSDDLGILSLSLNKAARDIRYVEETDVSFKDSLSRLGQQIHQRLDGNFQLQPDFKAVVGRKLYLVKPMQLRFWLKSAALADADTIARDLQDAAGGIVSRSAAG